MSVQAISASLLQQVIDMAGQMSNSDYARPLPILNQNTIGKHVRHIIEFYDCLIHGYMSGVVDYDARAHDLQLETDKEKAMDSVQRMLRIFESLEDKTMRLVVPDPATGETIVLSTSFNRELVYNNEHTIHHLAIVRIALQAEFPLIHVPAQFGVAYSTQRFNEKKSCAQ